MTTDSLSHSVKAPAKQASFSVVTRSTFRAAPDRVWDAITLYEEISERPPLVLRLLLPIPIATRGVVKAGADVWCYYDGGHILKRVTQIEPARSYRFAVEEQALRVGGGIRLSEGGYALRELADGTTEAAVETRYTGGRRPRWLWRPLEAIICTAFHRYLLRTMRARIEESS